MTWESVEEKRSTAQRLSNLKHSGASIDMKNFTGRESGNVRDIIARRVGLGSGVTYEKGKAVVEVIDTLINQVVTLQPFASATQSQLTRKVERINQVVTLPFFATWDRKSLYGSV